MVPKSILTLIPGQPTEDGNRVPLTRLVTGPAATPARIAYGHLELGPGASFAQSVAPGWTAAVVPLRGAVHIGGREVPADHVALLGEGDTVALDTPAGASLMVLLGEPIREPIAHYGPFVMNTSGEIEQAVLDYQQGRMGWLD